MDVADAGQCGLGAADGVAIWLADLRQVDAGALALWRGWLGAGEAQRHARFVRPQRQRQFVAGRGLLRLALGELLGVPAQTLQLVERPGLAPLLHRPDAAGPAPGFSISHSGDWVACAVSASMPLGLDIEVIDAARDIAALAEQTFTPPQVAALKALPTAARPAAFYAAWSAAEAQFKLTQGARQDAVPACVQVPHAQLSIALCTAQPLPVAPHLVGAGHLASAIARASSRCPATGA